MTEQVNAKSEEQVILSDEEAYDKEWDEDEESSSKQPDESPDSNIKTEDDESSESDTASDNEVVNSEGNTAPENNDSSPAEEVSGDDIWANATEEQRQAFEKVQNDFKSVTGRHKSAEQRKAELEKEFKELKAKHHELTREKGEYEQNHPELFNEVLEVVASRTQAETDAHTEDTDEDAHDEADDIRAVYKAHSDLEDVMSSPEWSTFTQELSDEQQTKYNSLDPLDFISLVTEFKVDRAAKASAQTETKATEVEESGTVNSGSGSKPDARVIMSDDDLYDAEWEKDD